MISDQQQSVHALGVANTPASLLGESTGAPPAGCTGGGGGINGGRGGSHTACRILQTPQPCYLVWPRPYPTRASSTGVWAFDHFELLVVQDRLCNYFCDWFAAPGLMMLLVPAGCLMLG
jgi:hypothetical protein